MTTKRRAGTPATATDPKKAGCAEKRRRNRSVRQRHTAKAPRKSTAPAADLMQPVALRKRTRKLVATVETKGREWTLTLRRPDGTVAALAIGKPGFVLDAQLAALTGGVRALRAMPMGGCTHA